MEKREFIIQFVLNRASAGGVPTDVGHWVTRAETAWELINTIAPYQPDYTRTD